MSNMTLVEGDRGVIVIDPLISQEVAAAALALYQEHRGDRAVTGVIYTHSHIDHFGGVLGVVDAGTTVPIYAPEHFLEHAVAENVYAGTAMLRRGYYYAAVAVDKSPAGNLGIGLGAGASTGKPGLLAPTHDITHTGQEEVIDGVRMRFQMTPGTEAPAEMNFLLPDKRVLRLAENATHNMHNILTLRGAEVRDARMWSRYLAEAVELFAGTADVAIASHHWPTWGAEAVVEFITEQRDLYAYLHDQTLRLLNKGYVGSEIAEMVELPPGLDRAWHTHGYYGSASHNEGDLPALPRLVRRQSGASVAAPAGGHRRSLRGGDRRGGRHGRQGQGVRRQRRPALRGRAGEPRRVRLTRGRHGPRAAGLGAGTARLRRRERDLAQLLSHRRPRAAHGQDRAHLHRPRRGWRPP